MTWSARILGVSDNPVPNGSKLATVQFTDGTRTFSREWKITPGKSSEDIQADIVNEIARIVAVENAVEALAAATVLGSTPAVVTNYQARVALMGAGLFDAVDAHVKGAGGPALQAWEYANNFYRDGALIAGLAPVFGLSASDVDALFVAAAAIKD
jgi:hypothetical protein